MIVKPSGHGTFHHWSTHTLPLLEVSPCVKWLVNRNNRNYLHPQYSYNMLQWYQALKWIKMVLWSTFAGYVENSLAVRRKDEKRREKRRVVIPKQWSKTRTVAHCGWTSWVPQCHRSVVLRRAILQQRQQSSRTDREIKSRWTRSMARCLVMQCCLAKIQQVVWHAVFLIS
jgi:hypothetical protein